MSENQTAGSETTRVAIITGGGSGIGRAAALALAGDGWTVVIAGRREQPLNSVVEDAERAAGGGTDGGGTNAGGTGADGGGSGVGDSGTGGSVHARRADVSNEGDVVDLFDDTVARFGRLDLLFNNAGFGMPPTRFDEIDLASWEAVMATTVTGSMLCAREAFRVMRAQDPQGGRIIDNGSISAYSPRPLAAAYTVAKHAISGLTKQLQLDGREFGIAAGQIDIGNAATDLTAAAASGAGSLQPDGSTRLEPYIDVAETGRAVLYMANLPRGVNVANLTIMPPAMPFVGRG